MYGTRDAPAAWSRLVRSMLADLGFTACRTAACVFVHPSEGLKIVSHVDDFLCSGPQRYLVELRKMLRDTYEVDGDILELDEGQQPEGKFLGRTIRYTTKGLEWEADRKQVESLLAEYGLESGNGADTPGVKGDEVEGELTYVKK